MSLKPVKFQVDQEILLSGRPMRVAGHVQYEGANGETFTRYLLTEAAGAPAILEESGARFTLLRTFPPSAQPEPSGSNLIVQGAKYTLAGVRKLKVLGVAGQPPGGVPKAELLLSGLFEGENDSLVREMTPGGGPQTFYLFKQVPADEVLTRAEQFEVERLAAEAKAQAEDGEDPGLADTPHLKAVLWIVVVVVVAGLAFACSGMDFR